MPTRRMSSSSGPAQCSSDSRSLSSSGPRTAMSTLHVPPPENLPSARNVRRAAIVAVVVAILLVVIVILPAERGIDLTGLGRVIGLTEMGEFKVENDKE